ncbi:toll/interleukin-1 receptor domain-containing protein [Paucibacter sp. B2R-40]|uniref:toll/interleukin-1 receptor domain-containing protein n=1 Tax=Paucibacter sp. B2R-40 TaxID=2893554 RepID=UPI0021E4DA64|nr:toll/interleukin-1 receptor domain-containing protein [Paucibacter sp. B2R-40]MCV2354009.1 toll/interleukin-1 receptor domain-containing protein [Paucibacter sp. B2R-40]
MGKAIGQTELFVMLLSTNFLSSRYCIETVSAEALEAMAERDKRVFVVLVGTCIYDAVPHGAPGGRVLGEVATQTIKTIVRDLQAAGPFDEHGRLVAKYALSPPRQDLAGSAVVGQIYRRFNLTRPAGGADEDRAAVDPDRGALLARCDRKPLLDRLETWSRGSAPALVVTESEPNRGRVISDLIGLSPCLPTGIALRLFIEARMER